MVSAIALTYRGRRGVAIAAFRGVHLGGRVLGNPARCDDASDKAEPTGGNLRRMDLGMRLMLGIDGKVIQID